MDEDEDTLGRDDREAPFGKCEDVGVDVGGEGIALWFRDDEPVLEVVRIAPSSSSSEDV